MYKNLWNVNPLPVSSLEIVNWLTSNKENTSSISLVVSRRLSDLLPSLLLLLCPWYSPCACRLLKPPLTSHARFQQHFKSKTTQLKKHYFGLNLHQSNQSSQSSWVTKVADVPLRGVAGALPPGPAPVQPDSATAQAVPRYVPSYSFAPYAFTVHILSWQPCS